MTEHRIFAPYFLARARAATATPTAHHNTQPQITPQCTTRVLLVYHAVPQITPNLSLS